MPGPVVAADELRERAVTADEKVRRHAQAAQARDVRVRIGDLVEPVLEQAFDRVSAVAARRQAD